MGLAGWRQDRLKIRPFQHDDLQGAMAVQAVAYPPFLREDEGAFASRLALSSSYCLVATREDELVAYVLGHGWQAGAPPQLGVSLSSGPTEVLFITTWPWPRANEDGVRGRSR